MSRVRYTRQRASWCARVGGGLVAAAVLAVAPAQAGEDYSFDFAVTLSEKAQAKLAAARETVTVLASYFGEPNRSGEQHANEVGMVDLGQETAELPPAPVTVRITGRQASRAKLAWIQGTPRVNVNLYTSRKSVDENLIDCDFIDGDIKQVRAAPITVQCFLIGERAEGRRLP